MADLAAFLRTHHAKFVEQASRALTRGEGLRVSVEGQVARFYELLANAVESGSSEWLAGLLKDWVDSRSAPSAPERQTLVPVILALKNSTWEVLLDGLPTAEALAALATLEPLLSTALQQLVELEIADVVADLERQLFEIRADLQKIDKTKFDFIAVAAHELKSPLTLIEGYSRMITTELSADDLPRIQALLAGVSTGTRRLREIVDDMVDVSLIDNRMLSLSYQPVWLRRLFEMIESELEDVVRQRRLQLRIDDFDDGGRPTLADPERLYQVFRNVMLNAVKFTPDGGAITVRAR